MADAGDYFVTIFGTLGYSFEMAAFAVAVAPVPLPAALILFGSALLVLWSAACRRRVKKYINTAEGLPLAV